jgi:calcineurin-like phosphoesterase family protein
MNAAILERVNGSVKPDDVLYFLGDFCMGGPKAVAFYRDQIACKTIHFIDGNSRQNGAKGTARLHVLEFSF